jgi:transposase InsO family protein
MELHKNARITPSGRMLLVGRILGGMSVTRAAEAAGVSRRTAFKWKKRFLEAAEAALVDRSSQPHRMPRQAHPDRVEEVLRLRKRRSTGPQIAVRVGLSSATVARILARHGLSRLKSLEPREPAIRYQRDHPGELVHYDIKKLGRIGRVGHRIHGDRATRARGIGWEFVHVAIDDASRLAYAEVLPNERSPSSTGFLRRSVLWFQNRGVTVQSVMSDNGSCYVSHSFQATCQRLKLRHLRTRPYRPRTNGKAERFIQTLLREWAYKRPYPTSDHRTDRLHRYLNHYNLRRPHAALNKRTPTQRLSEQPVEN